MSSLSKVLHQEYKQRRQRLLDHRSIHKVILIAQRLQNDPVESAYLFRMPEGMKEIVFGNRKLIDFYFQAMASDANQRNEIEGSPDRLKMIWHEMQMWHNEQHKL